MSPKQLDKFLRLLTGSPSGAVFNPWWEIDDENDVSPHSPAIRRKHLAVYFRERLGKARLAIVGEALGYRGGHFSGIPMTSERMLLGKKPDIVAALCERQNPPDPAYNGGRIFARPRVRLPRRRCAPAPVAADLSAAQPRVPSA